MVRNTLMSNVLSILYTVRVFTIDTSCTIISLLSGTACLLVCLLVCLSVVQFCSLAQMYPSCRFTLLVHVQNRDDALMGVGIAGMREVASVKCLHCHYAHYLAKPAHGNVIGRWVHELLQEMENESTSASGSARTGDDVAAAAQEGDGGDDDKNLDRGEVDATMQMELSRPRKSFPITDAYHREWLEQQADVDDAKPGEVEKFMQVPERRHCSAGGVQSSKEASLVPVGNQEEEEGVGDVQCEQSSSCEIGEDELQFQPYEMAVPGVEGGSRDEEGNRDVERNAASSPTRPKSALSSPNRSGKDKDGSKTLRWAPSTPSERMKRRSLSRTSSAAARVVFVDIPETPTDKRTSGNSYLCQCASIAVSANGGVGGCPSVELSEDCPGTASLSALCPSAPPVFAAGSSASEGERDSSSYSRQQEECKEEDAQKGESAATAATAAAADSPAGFGFCVIS
jgi:hypothetical protein